MSDDENLGADTGSDKAPDTSTRPGAGKTRPSPAAAAASRARRIGGGTTAGSSSVGGSPAKAADTATRSDSAASLKKQAVSDRARDGLPSASGRDSATIVTQVPPWLRWAPAGILVAAAIVMAVFVGVSGHGVWYAKPSVSSAREKVLAAAKSCTAKTNTYRYTTFAADEKKGMACTSGQQSARYKNAMETLIKASAVKLKASQIAQVNTAAVEQIAKGGKQWTVLLFGQLTVNTTQTKSGGRIDPFAAQVVMQKVGGKWLIAQINPVSSPTG